MDASISIRVPHPGVMRRAWASASPQVMRITGKTTDIWAAARRGWGRRVAFPRSEIFDIIHQADWCFDPLNDLFYANHPDVSLVKFVHQELFHGWKRQENVF